MANTEQPENPEPTIATYKKVNLLLEKRNSRLRAAINLINNHFPKEVLRDQMGEHYDDYLELTEIKK